MPGAEATLIVERRNMDPLFDLHKTADSVCQTVFSVAVKEMIATAVALPIPFETRSVMELPPVETVLLRHVGKYAGTGASNDDDRVQEATNFIREVAITVAPLN